MASKLQEIFEHAIGLEPSQRTAYLMDACKGDAELRAQVDGLLAAHDNADKFLASPTAADAHSSSAPTVLGSSATAIPALRERPGTRIGPYKLLQAIGEGGFGSVFMAEQERPVVRKVALKIIKLGMDTRQVVARFEQERQALALMDHPNIAKVFDAGATETGRPYFVMELVKGEAIVEYCDKHNLSVHDRLELFAQVCQAVQHAHTKGVIHRDIKPSNVLVSMQDGRAHAKVIDFGIAKATASKLTEKTLFTEHRALIGTPEYMSPEQAEGSLDIDTRTDVYSLGVLLYELLTGTTPFSGKELRSAAYAEIQRIIREVEPPRPSTRISANTESLASVAASRHTEPKRLGALVRGELDWIVMKALEKDRQRRYETANGLMMDVRRYLSGEAVMAAPPSAGYRFRKFVRRNRVAVAASSAVGAALLLGLAGTTWQAKVASEQRDVAVAAGRSEMEQRKAAEAARTEAVVQKNRAQEKEAEAAKQKAIAEGVVKFQADMLASVDPFTLPKDPETGEPLKDKVTVVQALEAALKAINAGSLKDSPMVEAGVLVTIGDTFAALGRYQEAEPVLRRAMELRKAHFPEGSLEIAQSMDRLADSLSLASKLKEAEELLRDALAIRRRALPEGDPSIGTAMNNLAQVLVMAGSYTDAEPLLREAVALLNKTAAPDKAELARTYDNLAKALTKLRKLDEAEQYMRKALQTRREAFPAGHPEIALGENNLATMLAAANKYDEAERLYRDSIASRRATLPAKHPEIARTLSNLGSVLKTQGKLAEAEAIYREALEINRANLPRNHPALATALNGLGMLLKDQGKLEQAEPIYREALAIRRESLPAGHPTIATSLNNLAVLLKDQRKYAEAEPLYRESLAMRREAYPPGHPSIAVALGNLAILLNDQGKYAEAEQVLREALEIRREAAPGKSLEIANTLSVLVIALQEQSKFVQAEPLAKEALDFYRAALPAGNERIAGSLASLARVQQGLGKVAQARAGWDEAISMLRKSLPESSQSLARVLWRSALARLENNDASGALPELEEAVALAEKSFKPGDERLAEYREALTKCKAALAKPERP
jgi:serine/threonine protein kinase/tetratricopeptide (TPR) repeat protein